MEVYMEVPWKSIENYWLKPEKAVPPLPLKRRGFHRAEAQRIL
jgi:hypothetical protein